VVLILVLVLGCARAEPAPSTLPASPDPVLGSGPVSDIPADWKGRLPVGIGLGEVALDPELPGLADRLHVLGFSAEGDLAILVEPADEAVGGYLWRFEVRDLRSDKVVESLGWTPQDLSLISDLASLLQAHGADFQAAMQRHGIRAQDDLKVLSTAFSVDEQTYEVAFQPTAAPKDQAMARSARVVLSSPGLGSKVLGTVSWSEQGACCGQPRAVVVLSPLEPRAAVIVGAWNRGWEGPPPTLHESVLGAHLGERFTAPGSP